MMEQFQVHTFGCKVNTYDSGLLQKNIAGHRFTGVSSSHVHVLNTCAVTAEATKEAVRTVRRIKAKDPLATIVVTGCAAQVDTDSFSKLPGVDLVVANSHKGFLPFLLDQYFKGELQGKTHKSNIFRKEDLEAGGGLEESHSRAFLKIQDGCNSFCTYCVIPFARGKSRSIPIQNLVRRARELHGLGFAEVVLTGVHIGDYEEKNHDRKLVLEDLLEALLEQTEVPRIRLTSLEPVEISDRLLELYHNPRLCAHFHMSIQSATTSVLAGMKRQYTQKEVIQSLQSLRSKVPGCFIGMDVITGFPGESAEDFEETYRVLAETPWTRLHVFPYSERPGTKATMLESSVPFAVRKERGARLRELSLHRLQAEMLAQVGTEKMVLILKNRAQGAQGLSRDYWPIEVGEVSHLVGQEVQMKMTGINLNSRQEGVLQGVLL